MLLKFAENVAPPSQLPTPDCSLILVASFVKAPVQDKNLAPHIVIEPVMLGPNITGALQGYDRTCFDSNSSGAFSVELESTENTYTGAYGSGFNIVNFNANNSNSIYNDSTSTIQPPSNQVLIIIKT